MSRTSTFSPWLRLHATSLLTLLLWVGTVVAACAQNAPATQGQVADSTELRILHQFYKLTGGNQWSNRANWPTQEPWPTTLTNSDFATWYGVGVTNGDVTSLRLPSNGLYGHLPASLGQLTGLQTLDLSDDGLMGTLPVSLGQLTKLQQLNLSNDGLLYGPIPTSLGQLTALQTLNLQWTPLTGSIPASLGQLTALQSLDLSYTHLSGVIPTSFGQLAALQYLSVEASLVGGPIPVELGQLTKLQYLDLAYNDFTGSIPASLGQCTSLQQLILAVNELDGAIPANLSQLTALQTLDLGANYFSGPIPAELGQLTKLQNLYLEDNQLSGLIPTEIGNLATLQYLFLYDNVLTGIIPPELGRLTNLQNLNLQNNQLTGLIPVALKSLTSLTYLDLGNNQLQGPIPVELGQLLNLRGLELKNNPLGNVIPNELGQLHNLQYLNLSFCHLTGSIPPSLSQVNSLTTEYLNDNELSGVVPRNWCVYPSGLTDLSNNHLTAIDDLLGATKLTTELRLSGNYLDFTALERLYQSSNTSRFRYSPFSVSLTITNQLPSTRVDTVTYQVGGSLALTASGAITPNTYRYQWQRLVNGQWLDMPGDTLATKTWSQTTAAEQGFYRLHLHDHWFTDPTLGPTQLYSSMVYADLLPSPALARNLPDDTNQGVKLWHPHTPTDSAATQPADMNYVRTWVPRVALHTATPAPSVATLGQGLLLREQWSGVPGLHVADIPVTTPPTNRSYVLSLQGPSRYGDYYGDRLSGYITAPQTGNYVLALAGNDDCELWLSTDDSPAHKQLRAWVNSFTNLHNYNQYAGQQSDPIALVAGQRYYVEVLHKENRGGGDHLEVAWTLPDGSFQDPIPGSVLTPYQPLALPVVGGVLREEWNSLQGYTYQLTDIPLTTPINGLNFLATLEQSEAVGDSYGDRIRGYLVPQVTGDYTLWVAGDHQCALWVSPDSLLAHLPTTPTSLVSDHTAPREWTHLPEQQSAPLHLVAGQRYYVEVQHKVQGGHNALSVAWQRAGGPFEGPIPGQYLAPYLGEYPTRFGTAPLPLASLGSTWTVDSASISTQYLDGLGRPVQTVLHQASPQRRDMVQPQAYDALGRETKAYLPYAVDTAGVGRLGYHNRALTQQQKFYLPSGQQGPPAPGDPTIGVARTGVAFAETLFEAAPLNRVLAQGAPGEAWQLTNGHVMERLERPNTQNDSVLYFKPGYDPQSLNPGYQGFYQPGELWGVEVMDPHGPAEMGAHGYKSIEWKDKLGQVVLKQLEAARAGRNDSSRWLRTAYVYDDFQRLRFVLQPEASKRVLALGNHAGELPAAALPFLFHYRYDSRGRQIAKQVPGQDGETLVVYDQLDRPVLSQDAQQRTRQEWSWSKYDALGRVVLMGLVTRPDALDQQGLQNLAMADTAISHQYEQRTADASLAQHYTTSQAFPQLGQNGFGAGLVLTASYYDDYDFDNNGQPNAHYSTISDAAFPAGTAPVADEARVTGMATHTLTRVLNRPATDPGTDWLQSTTFYDERGRVVQAQSVNARDSVDAVTMQLDFLGKPLRSVARHGGPSHAPIQVVETSTYDHAERLRTTRQQLPGEASLALLSLKHDNELGQLVVDSLASGRLAQNVKYAYNIRGWLTSFNNPYSPDPADLFNLSLHYEQGFSKGYEQYNGNLTGQTWRGRDGVQRAYGYVYDPLNRVLQGDYVARVGGSAGTLASASAWNQELDNYRLSFVSYDDNGNIHTLRRQGLLQAATHNKAKQYGAVDNLSYAYQGNRLQSIEDQVTGNQLAKSATYHGAPTSLAGDFQEAGVHQGQEYLYDANGNLTADKNKGITSILYNHLNLPRQIHFGTGPDSVVFRYTASGEKVAKLVYQTGKSTPQRTDYLGPYQYEGDSLKFFPHAAGRVLRFVQYDPAHQSTVSYQREYTLKDHLGNLRLAYRAGHVRRLLATMEQDDNTRKRETQQFDSLSVSQPIAVNTSYIHGAGNWAARLNAGTANGTPQPLGPLTQLGVQKGDTVTVQAFGYYAQATQHGFLFSLGSFLANLFHPAQSPPPGLEAQKRQGYPILQVGVAAGLASIPQLSGGVPKGYLRVLVFNKDSALIRQRMWQLSQAANGGYEQLGDTVRVSQDGYVTVYVGNESDVDVLFDDVSVEHRQGLQVQENQYDPWGLDLTGVDYNSPSILGLNRYQFNDKERQIELGLGWSDYGARFYDPARGPVWIGVDPLANKIRRFSPYAFSFDNALRFIDLDGKEAAEGSGNPPKPKTIMVFYHGGPTGDGQIRKTSNDNTGGTGRIYDTAMQMARRHGDAVGAIISPAFVAEPGVETGTKFLKNNYVAGDKVIIYGYSYGGDNAVNLADNAKQLGIPITALVTVDSSDGPGQGLTVNSTIPDNVNNALNVYQTQASGQSSSSQSSSGSTSESQAGISNSPASHGAPATASGKNRVQNMNVTAPGVNHGNIQDKQKGTIMSFINSILN